MSHNIETIAYAHKQGANHESYQTPWHGLGVPVSNDLTPHQMLEKAGLDWSVDRYPQFIEVDGERVPTGKDVLVRSKDKRIVTHISEDWEPVQNSELGDFMHEFCLTGDMEMNTAGCLATDPDQGPVTVWALAKVKDSFSLFKGKDQVDSYLLFSNPHQYGKCIDIRFTAIRVVCNNTLTLALNSKAQSDLVVRLNHRKKFDANFVKQTLGIARDNMENYKEMAEFLSKKKFSVDSLKEYYMTVFPSTSQKKPKNGEEKISRPARLAMDVVDTQPGHEFGKGTWWQAYNSVTFAIDHLVGHSQSTRLNSSWYGPNRQKKIKALETAVAFAEAA